MGRLVANMCVVASIILAASVCVVCGSVVSGRLTPEVCCMLLPLGVGLTPFVFGILGEDVGHSLKGPLSNRLGVFVEFWVPDSCRLFGQGCFSVVDQHAGCVCDVVVFVCVCVPVYFPSFNGFLSHLQFHCLACVFVKVARCQVCFRWVFLFPSSLEAVLAEDSFLFLGSPSF